MIPLADVKVGDFVLWRGGYTHGWQKKAVEKRTPKRIAVCGSEFNLDGTQRGDSFYRRSIRAFDQAVLDKQDSDAADARVRADAYHRLQRSCDAIARSRWASNASVDETNDLALRLETIFTEVAK